MTETAQRDHGRQEVPTPQDMIAALAARAARAPSVHNTQPWRFLASRGWLELHADHERNLPKTDPAGFPQMLLQLGHSHTAAATPRRRSADVLDVAGRADP